MKKKMLPDFYGVMEVSHYVEGRLRLRVASLVQDEEKANMLTSRLSSLRGIDRVLVNPLVGSVLVKFDEKAVDPITLVGAILNILDLEDEVFSRKNGRVFAGLRDVIDSVDFTIYNKTKGILDLKTVVALMFIVYGIKKIRQNPILPNGVNMLWWGYNIISRGGY